MAERSRLMQEALGAYGIKEENILASSEKGDRVVIVTNGGFKAKYEKGDKVKPLTPIQLGVPPVKPEPKED
jgi:hypothetical protein